MNNNDYENENIHILPYEHDQIKELLQKIDENFVLSPSQYKQLILDIRLDNISTKDFVETTKTDILTVIPTHTSQLINDSDFDTMTRVEESLDKLELNMLLLFEELETSINELEAMDIQKALDQLVIINNRLDLLLEMENSVRSIKLQFDNSLDSLNNIKNSMEEEIEGLYIKQAINETDIDSINTRIDGLIIDYNDVEGLITSHKNSLLNIETNIKANISDYLSTESERTTNAHIKIDAVSEDLKALVDWLKENGADFGGNFDSYKTLANDFQELREEYNKQCDLFNLHKEEFEPIVNSINEKMVVFETSSNENRLEIIKINDLINSELQKAQDFSTEFEEFKNDFSIEIPELRNNIELNSELISETNNIIENTINELSELEALVLENVDNIENLQSEVTKQSEDYNVINNKIISLNELVSSIENKENTNEEEIIQLKSNIELLVANDQVTNNEIKNNSTSIENNLKNIEIIDNNLSDLSSTVLTHSQEIETIKNNMETHELENEERIQYMDETVSDFESRIKATEANMLTYNQRIIDNENTILTLASQDLLKSLNLSTSLNDDGFIEINLILQDEILSTIVLPYDTDFEEQIARVGTAKVDYSKVL